MFHITGAFAEFERSMIRQRVRAGLKRAVESGKQRFAMEKRIQAQFEPKRACGTVQRVKREMEAAGPDLACRQRAL
jgi:DNA invertase Pin-like site-specific DNA recombinase